MDTNKNSVALFDGSAGENADTSEVTSVPIVPAAMGLNDVKNTEAELRRLHHVVEQLRENEIEIQRRNDLLEELIEHLPVNLSVQDEQGWLLFGNGVAAAQESPEQFYAGNKLIETEENISGPAGERTLLTRRKPV